MVSKFKKLPSEQSPMREPENLYKYIVLQEKNIQIITQNTNTSAGKESSTTGQ